MSNLYTTSRLRVFRECNRKHLYKYVLRIATPQTHAMAFGTHTHGALEAWYRAWQIGDDRLRAALNYIDAIEDIGDSDRVRLRVLAAAYDARWGGEPWEVLGVEVQFRYFLGDVELGGKIDAIIRDLRDGRVYVVEHKTSTADTSAGSPYWDRLAIDTQVSIYVDGAAFGLDYEIAGCIYDVIKRPLHELKLATPEAERKYTQGKGCKTCGGSAKPGAVEKGRGYKIVAFTTVEHVPCEDCDETGWKKDKDGTPEAPRLHANQRDTDETIEQFEDRLSSEVGERIDDFLSRGIVVRLDTELPRMRQELLDTIAAMRWSDEQGIAPPNHDACVRGQNQCAFFAACSGRASIDDHHVFPRNDDAHPELASAA